MELEVIGDCLVLDHMTQGGQIPNSDLRESAGLESGLVNQEVCPWYQLEGSCLESVGSVVLAGSEPPGVHDTQTEWQQKTLGGGGGEREGGCVCDTYTPTHTLKNSDPKKSLNEQFHYERKRATLYRAKQVYIFMQTHT